MKDKSMTMGMILLAFAAGSFGIYRLVFAKPYVLLGCLALVPALLIYFHWNNSYPFRKDDTGDDLFNMVGRLLLVAAVMAAFLGLMMGGGDCRNRYC